MYSAVYYRINFFLDSKHFFDTPLDKSLSQNPTGDNFTSNNHDEGFDNFKFHNPSKFNPRGPGALEAFAICNDPANFNPKCINVPITI